jgi:hypothetical protein
MMAQEKDMPGLSAIAIRKLLAAGKYSLPIVVGDPDAGPPHRGRL